ncbi:hypothetical protein PV08_11671 [Exophiala spinifera]|uniref:Gti1/Pac2 family protein n=1 Tax=Exophiala spinifera TaxID=91928 RepID=A0A0D1ZCE3_9EURO|nr:uncharacterized protein PV08_11671 [Exophiala spinifera]KIW10707.1 hypothetical protein PV08_11671 [Exophiala spinifera]
MSLECEYNVQPFYVGFVETRDDAVILIGACVRGQLRVVRRRPTLSERPVVAQSGHVFVYEEEASGIRRWTDARHWSPSRVLGEFLIYGERNQSHPVSTANQPWLGEAESDNRQQALYGPLVKSFHIALGTLVKKTIKVPDQDHSGTMWHVVSYYRPADVFRGQFQTPSTNQDFNLSPWYQPRDSVVPSGTSFGGDEMSESIVSPAMPFWEYSCATEHHHQPSWFMFKMTGDETSLMLLLHRGFPISTVEKRL